MKKHLHKGELKHGFYEYEVIEENGVISDKEFTYQYYDYVKDDNGRCYRMVDSCNLRIEEQLVKQRIKSADYEKFRQVAIEKCI